MNIGFTGTREGMTEAQHKSVLELLQGLVFTAVHHGDCIGADEEFHGIAFTANNWTRRIGHPPTDERFRAFCDFDETREPKPYLERNRDIVDETDLLIAAPKQATTPASLKGQGTWSTIFYALGKHKTVYLVAPDGSISLPVA